MLQFLGLDPSHPCSLPPHLNNLILNYHFDEQLQARDIPVSVSNPGLASCTRGEIVHKRANVFHSSESPKDGGVSHKSFTLRLTAVVLSEDQAPPLTLRTLLVCVPCPTLFRARSWERPARPSLFSLKTSYDYVSWLNRSVRCRERSFSL